MRTPSAKKSEIDRAWHLVDADGLILGRLASKVASLLRGKHRITFTPHVDCGDHVVVINASKIHMTGNKLVQKNYYRHSDYPGGFKSETAQHVLSGPNSDRVVRWAIQGMLPKNKLGKAMIKKLRVYSGPDHPHQAQPLKPLDLPDARRKT
ncbi:MAG TPA: 50S ribosomal protein L13 [Nitrospiria bacterium]